MPNATKEDMERRYRVFFDKDGNPFSMEVLDEDLNGPPPPIPIPAGYSNQAL